MPNERTYTPHPASRLDVIPALFVLGIVAAAVALPGLVVVWTVIVGLWKTDTASESAVIVDYWMPMLLVRSVGWALGIGLLATIIALPAAWAARAAGTRIVPLLLIPMLMPSYLAFAGWGLLRAPGTLIGNWLARGPSHGPNFWPRAADSILAIIGLSLWSWPLAAIILMASFRRVDDDTLNAVRLEPCSLFRRMQFLVTMHHKAIVSALVAVTLVMFGSAIPLHLAQVPTYAVELWFDLSAVPWDQRWRIWLAAWPLLLIASTAAFVISRRITTVLQSDSPQLATRGTSYGRARFAGACAVAVWGVSVLVPIALFALSLRSIKTLSAFWKLNNDAMLTSAAVSVIVGLLAILIAAAFWQMNASTRFRRLGFVCLGLLLCSGLIPGVLVGSATAQAWSRVGSVTGIHASITPLILGHVARFGFLPALVGCWLARTEPQAENLLRKLDGADGFKGWLGACLPTQVGCLVAVALACAALSFHEIESAVILQPPGADSFARRMLELLHFARYEDLSAGAIYVLSIGLILALAAAWLARPAASRQDPPIRTSQL